MAKRSEMAPEEIEQYLASSNDDLDTMGPGYRDPVELESCSDGGGTEQVKAQ